LNWTAIS